MKQLEGKVALISGGGTGIGAATARRLTAEGARVVVTGRREAPILAVADEIGGRALTGDVTEPGHAEEAVALAVEECHRRGLELHAWLNPYRARAGNVGASAAILARAFDEKGVALKATNSVEAEAKLRRAANYYGIAIRGQVSGEQAVRVEERSEEHTSELQSHVRSRMPSSA